jgi:cell division protein FtsI (penicillin-binding protein 3)
MTDSTSIKLSSQKIENELKKNIVPDLTGMTARDVLFLLENNGMRVQLIGSGAVAAQSIQAGTTFIKGTQIILQLI